MGAMITTIRVDLSWGGRPAEILGNQSTKKTKQTLKDLTGADSVEIIDINSWNEDDEENY